MSLRASFPWWSPLLTPQKSLVLSLGHSEGSTRASSGNKRPWGKAGFLRVGQHSWLRGGAMHSCASGDTGIALGFIDSPSHQSAGPLLDSPPKGRLAGRGRESHKSLSPASWTLEFRSGPGQVGRLQPTSQLLGATGQLTTLEPNFLYWSPSRVGQVPQG